MGNDAVQHRTLAGAASSKRTASQSNALAGARCPVDSGAVTDARKIIALPDGAPLTIDGHRVQLLADSRSRIDQYIGLIDGAAHSVAIIIYILDDDAVGRRVRDALVAAAARGVDVRLIVDSFGSGDTTDAYFAPLREAGATAAFFSRRWRSTYLIRNHQKLLLVDGDKLFIGGFNLASSYFDNSQAHGWSDLGIIIFGPVAAEMADWFDRLFDFATNHDGQWLKLRRLMRDWHAASRAHRPFRWLMGGPTERLSPWTRQIRTDLTVARRIDMVMAYFSPGRGMLRRLARVARRGPVRIVTAARSDNGATVGAARLLYRYLLRKQVAIFEYQPQRLHMKLIVVDDIVYVGSANFDMRSLFVNLELMLRIEDARLAAQARELIDHMVADSEAVTLDWVKRRGGGLTRLRWILSWFVVSTLDYNVARRLNFGLEDDQT
ncbi:MAG: phosphatidylserine/phosphatidylglycerophosphate/cardiolipin synthase family protein [Sphingopyxis sp.]|nr:phosphatidylserine/phosphatidylglycerophosphate/cardiolipin synthase family protein [Sphingopyxis sp.]